MPKRTIRIELDDQFEFGFPEGARAALIEAENRALRRAAAELREEVSVLLLDLSRTRRLR
jgi:hypothetical protein